MATQSSLAHQSHRFQTLAYPCSRGLTSGMKKGTRRAPRELAMSFSVCLSLSLSLSFWQETSIRGPTDRKPDVSSSPQPLSPPHPSPLLSVRVSFYKQANSMAACRSMAAMCVVVFLIELYPDKHKALFRSELNNSVLPYLIREGPGQGPQGLSQ